MKKPGLNYLLIFLCFTIVFLNILAGTKVTAQEVSIKAESAILMEAETGQILYEKKPEEKLPPASITKIMTLLVAMEEIENNNISLEDEVMVSQFAESMGGSQIYLPGNVKVKMKDLLKAVAIASANDASVAVAEAISGSYSQFINLMNQKAEELGMDNTHFMNSTGLPQENHFTTARDISIMARELVKYEKVLEWTSIWVDYIQLPDREAMLANTNKLVNKYPGMDGLKTGHTDAAGFCLAATAKRDNVRLISVVLNCDTASAREESTKKLLDFGFNYFVKRQLVNSQEKIKNIRIPSGKDPKITGSPRRDLYVMVKRGADIEPEVKIKINQSLQAPLEKGETIGKMNILQQDKQIASVDIITPKKVEKTNIFIILWRKFVHWIENWIRSFS